MAYPDKKTLPFNSAASLRLATEGRRAFQSFLQTDDGEKLAVAESKYQECIEKFPEDTAAKLFFATMKLVKRPDGTDRTDEAILLLKSFDETDRWYYDATFNLASAYIVKRDERQAIELLTKLSKMRGVKPEKRAKVEYNWGVMEKISGRLENAKLHFKRAAKIVPQACIALQNLDKPYLPAREPIIIFD